MFRMARSWAVSLASASLRTSIPQPPFLRMSPSISASAMTEKIGTPRSLEP